MIEIAACVMIFIVMLFGAKTNEGLGLLAQLDLTCAIPLIMLLLADLSAYRFERRLKNNSRSA